MNQIFALIKDLFTLSDDDNLKIGLSQFKKSAEPKESKPKTMKRPDDIKLSDLMKRSY